MRHIENLKQFGVPVVVAINHFVTDTNAEIDLIVDEAMRVGVKAFRCEHWGKGSAGIIELAEEVVSICEANVAQFAPLYQNSLPCLKRSKSLLPAFIGQMTWLLI